MNFAKFLRSLFFTEHLLWLLLLTLRKTKISKEGQNFVLALCDKIEKTSSENLKLVKILLPNESVNPEGQRE